MGQHSRQTQFEEFTVKSKIFTKIGHSIRLETVFVQIVFPRCWSPWYTRYWCSWRLLDLMVTPTRSCCNRCRSL